MNIRHLVTQRLRAHPGRALTITLLVMAVSCFLLSAVTVVDGAKYSMEAGMDRLGANIIVVPEGSGYEVGATPDSGCGGPRVVLPVGSTALLAGSPVSAWMPRSKLDEVASIPGVEAVSAQLYLASVRDSPYCSLPEMYLVVFDPATDFTIGPWLRN